MRLAARTDANHGAVVSFTVPGVPVAKARARTVRHNGRTRTYTPTATAAAERAIGIYARQALKRQLAGPLAGPLALEIVFHVPIPSSFSKTKRAACVAGSEHPAVRSDLDNYVKLLLDGCNRVAWFDDGQVCEIRARKVYAATPRTEVRVLVLAECQPAVRPQ